MARACRLVALALKAATARRLPFATTLLRTSFPFFSYYTVLLHYYPTRKLLPLPTYYKKTLHLYYYLPTLLPFTACTAFAAHFLRACRACCRRGRRRGKKKEEEGTGEQGQGWQGGRAGLGRGQGVGAVGASYLEDNVSSSPLSLTLLSPLTHLVS